MRNRLGWLTIPAILLFGVPVTWGGAVRPIRLQHVPSQPLQPARGPGSSQYAHASIHRTGHGQGSGQYWVFTPDAPRPVQAPLVVFLHGWSATDPSLYGAWIKHLVRRGNIVVYPRYQDGLGVRPGEFVSNAVTAVHQAIERIPVEHSMRVDLERVAFVGHSMGAIMSANMAQDADRLGLPAPRALFLAEPAFEPLLGSYQRICEETLIVVAVGADAKRDGTARRILQNSTHVPAMNKNYVAFPSDPHGSPPLVSDHFAPCAAEPFDDPPANSKASQWQNRTRDCLDYFGYWKLCDGLLDAAFFDRNRQFALEDSPELRFMGQWSDGTPVKPAVVLPIPPASTVADSLKSGR